MTATYPILRLGCTLIDPRQAWTYWTWAVRNGQITGACCPTPVAAGGCWADAPSTPYTDPGTDCAAWIDLGRPESGDFLGAYLFDVQGLDDTVTARSSTQNIDGGATSSAPVVSGRGIRIRGWLIASSCAGMEWGKQWLRRTLDEACRWSGTATGPCGSGAISVRAWCPDIGDPDTDGIRDLVNVTLSDGPTFSPVIASDKDFVDPCPCNHVAFEAVLLAGDPHLYRPAETVIARSAISVAGFDDTPLAYSPLPLPSTVDDPACTIAPPPVDASLPEYDDQGRPSCGTGSGGYLSPAEVIVTDERGRPSAGPGSALYLRSAPQLPELDFAGRPSCGPGSGLYWSWPATPAVTDEVIYRTSTPTEVPADAPVTTSGTTTTLTTTYTDTRSGGGDVVVVPPVATPVVVQTTSTPIASPWQTATVSLDDLVETQAENATVKLSGSGRIRDVKVRTYAVNDYAPVPQTLVYTSFAPGEQTLPITFDAGVRQSIGYRYRIVVEWSQRVDAGQNLEVSWSCPAQLSFTGANNDVDVPCAASLPGPNGGVDRTARTTCVSRLAALPTVWESFHDTDDHSGDEASMLASVVEDEGDRAFGTLTPSGLAWFTLRTWTTADVCPGSTILWARLRVKFQSPRGPNNGAFPWTIEARTVDGSVVYGGRTQTLDVVDGTTEVLYPLDMRTPTDFANFAVRCNLAGPVGGTEGWLEYIALEAEFVGGNACIDCGPNGGIDAPCAPAVADGCWEQPSVTRVISGRYVAPTVATAAPVVTIEAGTVAARNLRVQAWGDALSRTAPEASQAAYDYWRSVIPCLDGRITWIPAGGRLILDHRARTATLAVNGVAYDATRFLSSADGPWRWRNLAGPCRVAVIADNANWDATNGRVTVTAHIAEGV